MSSDLGRGLAALAHEAPSSLAVDDLWVRGTRRHRRNRAAGAAGVVLALVMVGFSLGGSPSTHQDGAPPLLSTPAPGHLPRTINPPAAWSPGTEDAGEIGPLAAIASSNRKRPLGVVGSVSYEAMYGVSAQDGTARFLDLPYSSSKDMPGELVLSAALSPDGLALAYPRYDWTTRLGEGSQALVGWAIYNAATGRVVELSDPEVPRLSYEAIQPVFSGDSRFLLTAYAPEGRVGTTADSLVAWEVATGKRIVLEKPGRVWAPNVGSAPQGLVWSRANKTYTYDPSTGTRTVLTTPLSVVTASYAPRGNGFAYVGGNSGPEGIVGPWYLFAGPSPDRVRRILGTADTAGILGWRDPEHVVVAVAPQVYAIVDIIDGSIDRGEFKGEVNLNTPMLAADLWAHGLVAGVEPPSALDPRTRSRLVGLTAVLGLIGTGLALKRRRRARD